MGLISAGASASAIIFYPLNTYLIVVVGWRTALVRVAQRHIRDRRGGRRLLGVLANGAAD